MTSQLVIETMSPFLPLGQLMMVCFHLTIQSNSKNMLKIACVDLLLEMLTKWYLVHPILERLGKVAKNKNLKRW